MTRTNILSDVDYTITPLVTIPTVYPAVSSTPHDLAGTELAVTPELSRKGEPSGRSIINDH